MTRAAAPTFEQETGTRPPKLGKERQKEHRQREKARLEALQQNAFELTALIHAVREQAWRRAGEFDFIILADDEKLVRAIHAAIVSGAWGIEQLPAGDAK
jgi:hypothetical protein